MLHLGSVSPEQQPSWLDLRVLALLWQRPVDLYVDVLVLPSGFVPGPVFDVEHHLLQNDILLEVLCWFEL